MSPSQDVAVASPLALATEGGQQAADEGGNAIDAALATAALLTVAYPHNCSLGGDLIALIREPDGSRTVINASGRAPIAADVHAVRLDHREMPLTGPHAVTVPGIVSGWDALYRRGCNLPWARLLEPAMLAAQDGVPVSKGLASALDEDEQTILGVPELREVFAPGGDVLRGGQPLAQPALAQTLERLMHGGAAEMYTGIVAKQLVDGLNQLGLPLTAADLSAHTVTEETPLTTTVDGWTVDTAAPNSQGFALLRVLAMLALASNGSDSPLVDRVPLSVLARAFQQAADERDTFLADPASMSMRVEDLLTVESLEELARMSATGMPPAEARESTRPTGDTVAIVTADSEGRSVSLIQSTYHSFGSHLLEPTTGVIMHNRGGSFSLDPTSPNVLAPRKRPAHTLTPVLAERGNERLVVGTMGGEMQPQILTQVLSSLLAGDSAQRAVSAPRWTVGAWDRGEPVDQINAESDVDERLRADIESWPGRVNWLPARSGEAGHTQAIRVTPSKFDVGTDPRADAAVT